HDSLRTRFVDSDGNPTQMVDRSLRLRLESLEVAAGSTAQREEEAQALIRAEVNRPFNLSAGLPIRATLIRVQSDDHWFILNIHHIVSDEWSLKICFRELSELYAAHCEHRQPQLRALPIQYADYSIWQHGALKNGALEQQLDFWRRQLDGPPPVL